MDTIPITEADAQAALQLAKAALLAELRRRGAITADVTAADVVTHHHKSGSGAGPGPGLWFRLPDDRVYDQFGNPCCADRAHYDRQPVALSVAIGGRFAQLVRHITEEPMRDAERARDYEAMEKRATKIGRKWERAGWTRLALIERLSWDYLHDAGDPEEAVDELNTIVEDIAADVQVNLAAGEDVVRRHAPRGRRDVAVLSTSSDST